MLIKQIDLKSIEVVIHDVVDQYARNILHRLIRNHKYQRRSREQVPLSGMTLIGEEQRRNKQKMLINNQKEQKNRVVSKNKIFQTFLIILFNFNYISIIFQDNLINFFF